MATSGISRMTVDRPPCPSGLQASYCPRFAPNLGAYVYDFGAPSWARRETEKQRRTLGSTVDTRILESFIPFWSPCAREDEITRTRDLSARGVRPDRAATRPERHSIVYELLLVRGEQRPLHPPAQPGVSSNLRLASAGQSRAHRHKTTPRCEKSAVGSRPPKRGRA